MLIAASVYVWMIIVKKVLLFWKLSGLIKEFKEYVKTMPKFKRLIVEETSMHFEIYDKLFCNYINEHHGSRYELSSQKFEDFNESVIKKWEVKLEKDLNYLSAIGMISPFIGLFGTVWGIMNSFQSIANSNSTSIAIVAPGISEALFATAVGLFVAIPATVAAHLLASKIDDIFKDFHIFGQHIREKLEEDKHV